MNQKDLEQLLMQSLDGELGQEDQSRLDQALAQSGELRDMEADLRQLSALASEPVQIPELQPSAAMLDAVAARTDQVAEVVPFQRKIQPIWLALAALVVFGIGFALFRHQPTEGVDVQSGSLLSLQEAESQEYFHRAIAPLEKMANRRLVEMSPKKANTYMEHLNHLNKMLRHCESILVTAPGNNDTHLALAQVYEAKVNLLERIVGARA